MTPMAFTRELKRTAFVAILISSCSVNGADTDEVARELLRFVKAYRFAEAVDISMKIAMQMALREGRVSGQFVDCMRPKLAPQLYEEAALEVAREHFVNLSNLKEINAFLESPAGRKVIEQAMKWHAASFESFVSGREPPPPPPAQYTARELAEIQALENRRAHSDFKRFVDVGLRNIQANEKVKSRFTQIKDQRTS